MLGGMLEPGESPRDAALRELDEEAGVRPPALLTFAVDDHPSLRRPGKTVRSHVFAAAVDWSLDDLTLGEGQAIDWFMPAEVPALSLVLPLAPLILRFLASDLYARLAGDGAAQRPALAGPLPPELPAALGLRPGHLLAVRGLSAGFVCRLRDVLDGVRVTASPAAEERPDVILWRPRGEDVAPALGAWRDRMAPNGVLWLLDPAGSDATLTAARGAGFALSVRVLPGGLGAVRLQPLK